MFQDKKWHSKNFERCSSGRTHKLLFEKKQRVIIEPFLHQSVWNLPTIFPYQTFHEYQVWIKKLRILWEIWLQTAKHGTDAHTRPDGQRKTISHCLCENHSGYSPVNGRQTCILVIKLLGGYTMPKQNLAYLFIDRFIKLLKGWFQITKNTQTKQRNECRRHLVSFMEYSFKL